VCCECDTVRFCDEHTVAIPGRELWRTCARLGILLYSGWIPGREVVRLGVDGLSRASGVDNGDLRTGPVARQGIAQLCTDLGWRISVDLFSSPENSLCVRFCTRLHTTLGETADAFTRQSWSSYNCVCGSRHADVVYAFPPDPILLRVWSRLRRDGTRGLALVPQWVSAPWWSILKSGLVREMIHIPGSDIGVVTGNGKDGGRAGPDRLGARSYVLVAFDFAPGRFTFEPYCAQARPRRCVHERRRRSALDRHCSCIWRTPSLGCRPLRGRRRWESCDGGGGSGSVGRGGHPHAT
jgi:hypothetical protein